jgi:hypothetical protein
MRGNRSLDVSSEGLICRTGGLMPAIRAADDSSAFYSEHSGIDWNIVFLLLGMMVIVGVLKKTGNVCFRPRRRAAARCRTSGG